MSPRPVLIVPNAVLSAKHATFEKAQFRSAPVERSPVIPRGTYRARTKPFDSPACLYSYTRTALREVIFMRVNRRSFLCSSVALAGADMLGSPDGHADQIHSHPIHAASLMTECANRFLAALDAKQRSKATFPFDSDERMNWHFIPKERKGVPLREMTPYQKHLAHALLAAGLSQAGYIKAVTIMSLEDVLKIIESDNGEVRNPEKYYFSLFG